MESLSDDAIWHISRCLPLRDLWSWIQVSKQTYNVCRRMFQRENLKRNSIHKFRSQILRKIKAPRAEDVELIFRDQLETIRLKTARDTGQFTSFQLSISHTLLDSGSDDSLIYKYIQAFKIEKSKLFPDLFRIKTLMPRRVYHHLRFKENSTDEDFQAKLTFILGELFSRDFKFIDHSDFFKKPKERWLTA